MIIILIRFSKSWSLRILTWKHKCDPVSNFDETCKRSMSSSLLYVVLTSNPTSVSVCPDLSVGTDLLDIIHIHCKQKLFTQSFTMFVENPFKLMCKTIRGTNTQAKYIVLGRNLSSDKSMLSCCHDYPHHQLQRLRIVQCELWTFGFVCWLGDVGLKKWVTRGWDLVRISIHRQWKCTVRNTCTNRLRITTVWFDMGEWECRNMHIILRNWIVNWLDNWESMCFHNSSIKNRCKEWCLDNQW